MNTWKISNAASKFSGFETLSKSLCSTSSSRPLLDHEEIVSEKGRRLRKVELLIRHLPRGNWEINILSLD